jgi:NAD(P)-dependent dehydrogenase (short-subunit alcohol dehydrogenase family)
MKSEKKRINFPAFKNISMRKTVLITGGSRGIGRSTAIKFSEEGYKVIFTYKSNREAAKKTFNLLTGEGHEAIMLDLCDPLQIKKMAEEVLENHAKIDVLVNNAGIFEEHKIDQVTYDQWQQSFRNIMDTNLIGLANITFLIVQNMMKQKAGHIINVSSRGAFRGEPDFPAYGASKGALNSLSQSLAKTLGRYNISVVAVAPGFVNTDMAAATLESHIGDFIRKESPFGRVASPEEVAHTIYFLAQDEATFLSGGIVDINGASFLRM